MPEYTHGPKSRDWYIAFGILCFSLTVTAFILGNVLFGILMVLVFFTVYMYTIKPLNMIDIELTHKGIRINKQLFQYNNLEGFWIEEYENKRKLLLKSKKLLVPLIVLPIADEIDTIELKSALLKEILEEELKEPVFERILEKFNF